MEGYVRLHKGAASLLERLSENALDALRQGVPAVDEPGWQELAGCLVEGQPVVTGTAATGELMWSLTAHGRALRAELLRRDADA